MNNKTPESRQEQDSDMLPAPVLAGEEARGTALVLGEDPKAREAQARVDGGRGVAPCQAGPEGE